MRTLVASIWLTMVACTAQAGLDFSGFGQLAIQEGGRKKPFDTFAREAVQRITGKKRFNNEDPVNTVLSVAFSKDGNAWADRKLVRIGFEPLKKQLGLPVADNYFSAQELHANPRLRELFEQVSKPKVMTANPTVKTKDPVEEEAKLLFSKLAELRSIAEGTALAMVPHPSDPEGAWVSPVDERQLASHFPEKARQIQEPFTAVAHAYMEQDAPAFAQASDSLALLLRQLSPNVYPNAEALDREITYNRFHPFRWAWMAALVSLVLLAATVTVRTLIPYWTAIAFFAAALALQVTGFVFRCLIAERPPVTNMYESVIWVSFGASLFALVFEMIHRTRYFAMAASGFVVLALLLADQFPNVLNPSIQPLTPVLRDNFWLTVHVLTITLGYAAFGLTFALGHISLGYHLWKPNARPQLEALTLYIYRAMQVGVLLLAAGTGLGGLWAYYSWGRFWGWDPKETWALIALLSYLVVLHGRFSGWLTNFSLNVAAVACFNSVLMAWYGVNFVLGTGLHSYGFGTGGLGYVAGFVLADLAFVGFAAWRYKRAVRMDRTEPVRPEPAGA